MKFDVVLGNPPYNNDMYIDFVELGHNLAKFCDSWITPAKFWAKFTCDKDLVFRDLHTNFGKYYVVYKDCKDIFPNISEPGGITYYILNKSKSVNYDIKCCHKSSKAFNSDFESHSDLTFLPLKVLSILKKVGDSNFKDILNHNVSYFVEHTFEASTDSSLPIKVYNGSKLSGYTDEKHIKHKEDLGKFKCIQAHTCGSGAFQADDTGKFLGLAPIYILNPNEVGRGFHHLMLFDTRYQAENFVRFMETKFVNFLYVCGVCGTCNSKEFYRYIPDIIDFNVIYEDKPLDNYIPDEDGKYLDNNGNKHCSLYTRYNLTDDEIDLIESTIRNRV